MLDTGTEAPTFELPDQNGDPVALSDFEGQWVVLYFYPRADTRGCTTEAKGFREHIDAFEAHDAVVLGISNDPVEDLREFADKYRLPFELLSDEDGEVASAYDSYGTVELEGETHEIAYRNTYLIDPEGRVARVYERVEPDGHAGTVLADLEAART